MRAVMAIVFCNNDRNRHHCFDFFMANIKKAKFIALAKFGVMILCVISIILIYAYMTGYFSIDDCLDNGGKWNYDSKECETQ